MNVERLRLLEATLRDLDNAKQKLNLPEGKDPENFKWSFDTFGNFLASCGTVACAFGLAAFIPEFQQQGLMPNILWTDREKTQGYWEFSVDGIRHSPGHAAARFFDIPYSGADLLFTSTGYNFRSVTVTPTEVADRIAQYIDEYPDAAFSEDAECLCD